MNKIPHTFKQYLAYSASAGSGKTFALSVRYISLLFLGETPRTILAATFTNKAASEMKERVIDSLRNLKTIKNRPILEAISKETNMSIDEILSKQPLVLMKFLESSNFIVTLDSFFTSILRSSSFEIGLEPEFNTQDSGEDGLDKIFLGELEYMGLLNSLVNLSIDINDKRFSNIFKLMQGLYKLDPILPNKKMAFPNIKIIENNINKTRLELLNLVILSGASKSAINNFRESSIKEIFKKGVFEKESLLDHRNYKKYVIKYPHIDILYKELKSLLAQWVKVKESIILNNLFELYSYYKNANIINAKTSNTLSFDDLSYFTYRLLHETVTKEFIYFKIDSKFKHILLDEFQDTSTIQFLMLKPLIDEIFSVSKDEDFRSFFYVGDTKQSLYRFRGGVEELFDTVANVYNIDVLPMDTNYRSSKFIVDFVNNVFKDKMIDYIVQKSKESANLGYVEVIEVEPKLTSEDILLEAINKAKELISKDILLDDITFLVATNRDGERLQNLCHNNNIDTILKTSSSLKKIGKIASIIAVIKYLFYNQKTQYSAYKSAFLENIDIDENQIDFSWFHSYMRPFDIIDKLVDSFGYFNQDPNILKLLNFSSKYTDIPSFIDDFENTSLAVASNTLHGAFIMTIHGSKGLEFDNVIVLDRLTKEPNDTEAILLDFNNQLFVEDIFYRISKRDNFDDDYKNLLANRKKLTQKDTLNILYVALTRAIENLIIIKKKDKSVFDIINLKAFQNGSIVVKPKKLKDINTIKKDKPITINNYGQQNIKKEKEDSDTKDYMAITFGLAMHYTLEMMGYFKKEEISRAIESSKNHYGLVLEDKLWEDIKNRIIRLVENEEFNSIIKDAKLYKEKSISFNGELKQIDLLLEYKNSYLVIDYKSSKKFHLKHQQQVSNYIDAIKNITNKETKGVILYLLQDNIEIIYL